MSQYTPGEWTMRRAPKQADVFYVEAPLDDSVWLVAEVAGRSVGNEANARLITAAPKMLAYLKVLRNDIIEHGLGLSMVALESLIAEAEGE